MGVSDIMIIKKKYDDIVIENIPETTNTIYDAWYLNKSYIAKNNTFTPTDGYYFCPILLSANKPKFYVVRTNTITAMEDIAIGKVNVIDNPKFKYGIVAPILTIDRNIVSAEAYINKDMLSMAYTFNMDELKDNVSYSITEPNEESFLQNKKITLSVAMSNMQKKYIYVFYNVQTYKLNSSFCARYINSNGEYEIADKLYFDTRSLGVTTGNFTVDIDFFDEFYIYPAPFYTNNLTYATPYYYEGLIKCE